jgi:WD40 repeat protein
MCVAEQSPAVEAVFVSATRFVTATPEGVLKVWRIKGGSAVSVWTDTSRMMPIAVLRGHEDVVNRLTASSAWSVLISSSEDGSAIVWDTNRFKFVRRLVVEPSEPVRFAAVDDATVCLYDGWAENSQELKFVPLAGSHRTALRQPYTPVHPERGSHSFC